MTQTQKTILWTLAGIDAALAVVVFLVWFSQEVRSA